MNFSKLKQKILNAFNNQFSTVISSVLIAIVLWFLISITQYETMTKNIDNIPVSTELSKDFSESSGLSLISCDTENVNVKIEGNRTEIGGLKSDDLVAKLVTDNISSSGTKTVAIKIESKSGREFEIKSISPSTASIVLDKIETREFPVSPEIPNISFADGKTFSRDDLSCDPAVINITGPSEQLNKIAKCTAVSHKKATLDTSYNLQSDEIRLYDENNSIIENSGLSIEKNNIMINIPVLTQKKVGLSVSILNAPADFDKDFLDFSISADNIVLASENSSAEFPDPFEVAQIPLSDIDIDYSNTFTVDTKKYINQSNLETVTVKLNNENLAKKQVVLTDISISNPQPNYDYEIIAKSINVTVIGPADIIKDITASDFVANVNLLNESSNSDSFIHDVSVSCPKYNNVWVYGTSKVTVNRTEKTVTSAKSTTAPNASTTTTTADVSE
ncbi:MAG: hypothetical protein SPE43_01350 [Ruminococcus sp.]|nr:hypothetical protein [Oscillospiraceae bacterium]MDY4413011.1 hypothetical protein [Ruminococcus sp.]